MPLIILSGVKVVDALPAIGTIVAVAWIVLTVAGVDADAETEEKKSPVPEVWTEGKEMDPLMSLIPTTAIKTGQESTD